MAFKDKKKKREYQLKRYHETKKLKGHAKGDKVASWKGDKVGYGGIHAWIRRRKIKPDLCEECQKRKPQDLANISGEYKRDTNDFEWLCRRCHMIKNGRMEKLIKGNKERADEKITKIKK